MKSVILKVWDAIDNWKTAVGILAWFAYQSVVAEGWIEPDTVVLDGIYALIGVGLADKIKKITEALRT